MFALLPARYSTQRQHWRPVVFVSPLYAGHCLEFQWSWTVSCLNTGFDCKESGVNFRPHFTTTNFNLNILCRVFLMECLDGMTV